KGELRRHAGRHATVESSVSISQKSFHRSRNPIGYQHVDFAVAVDIGNGHSGWIRDLVRIVGGEHERRPSADKDVERTGVDQDHVIASVTIDVSAVYQSLLVEHRRCERGRRKSAITVPENK